MYESLIRRRIYRFKHFLFESWSLLRENETKTIEKLFYYFLYFKYFNKVLLT